MPVFKSFWTEATGHLAHAQTRDYGYRNRCADYELNAWECIEAYGYYRAERYCKEYLDDWGECSFPRKTRRRSELMFRERMKQVVTGQRKPLEFWSKTPVESDAYIFTGFRV